MAFEHPELLVPETYISPSDARAHLGSFVDWLRQFFRRIRDEVEEQDLSAPLPDPPFRDLFEDEIEYLRPALQELDNDGLFSEFETAVRNMPVEQVKRHGLWGTQLVWKFKNINRRLLNFIREPSARLLDWLLDAIESLLDSLLDTVPVVGGAIKEIKEAIKNSIKRPEYPVNG